MQLIFPEQLDRKAWDALVLRCGGSVFSATSYSAATAENWAVLMTDDRSAGMMCPYTVRAGVRVLYAPFFHRYTEWIGENQPDLQELIKVLKGFFPVAEAHFAADSLSPENQRLYQQLDPAETKPNQQARRMLKKAAGFTVREGRREAELFDLLRRELSPRITTINEHSLSLLKKLIGTFGEKDLIQLNLFRESEWKGGVWLLPFNGRMLYLKGTVAGDAREKGGMYLLMRNAIQLAGERGMLFDFGGSNAEGVRRFNLNWGAKDIRYTYLRWNNAPWWWKLLRALRKLWKNK